MSEPASPGDPSRSFDWAPFDLAARERLLLAPYALHSADTAGRKHPEPPHAYRGPFQRDRDRIVHCAAYRRLSHKMQVFTGELGDYHRTRLTHTIEVASVARTLARALRLNEDLVEALALAHDLGHPPFGHAGEAALDECLKDEGGFSHNRHGLRIVEQLELRYQEFPGLNLSIEVLEGQESRIGPGDPHGQPLLEVQVVEAADSLAYDTHDADDALELRLLSLHELEEVPLWRETAQRVRDRYANIDDVALRRAVVHELVDVQVGDLLSHSSAQLANYGVDSAAAARRSPWLVEPSSALAQQKIELEQFLHQRVYRHPQLMALRTRGQQVLREMFAGYLARPELMPASFQSRAAEVGWPRSVGDYIAGMTDRYAEQEHARLFSNRDLGS